MCSRFFTRHNTLPMLATALPKSPHQHPRFQNLYSFNSKDGTWSKRTLTPVSSHCFDRTPFRVLTWNIDFMAPLPIRRLKAAISHLESLLSPLPDGPCIPPTIILIQELFVSCFPALISHPFIRTMYEVTDISEESWPEEAHYGTVTLVPKTLAPCISAIFRTALPKTQMDRDALFIDLKFNIPCTDPAPEAMPTTIRIANTHLESLRGHGDRVRPVQLASVAQFLSCAGIHGGLVAGDMNALSPSDIDLPERVNLVDAWKSVLQKSPAEVSDNNTISEGNEGHTWGYQPPSRFPPGRLDKILIAGKLHVEEIERVGVGLRINDVIEGRENAWVSDHYGLLVTVASQP